MTTIAYDGTSIVADRYWRTCYGDKLSEVGGKYIGFTGPAHLYQQVLDYFTSGGDPPDLDTDAEVIVVDARTGEVWLYDHEMDQLKTEAPVAIGNGYQIAMGYMFGGGNAEGAVKAAAVLDPHTKMDGGITEYKVKRGKDAKSVRR
mgnify:FL=1